MASSIDVAWPKAMPGSKSGVICITWCIAYSYHPAVTGIYKCQSKVEVVGLVHQPLTDLAPICLLAQKTLNTTASTIFRHKYIS